MSSWNIHAFGARPCSKVGASFVRRWCSASRSSSDISPLPGGLAGTSSGSIVTSISPVPCLLTIAMDVLLTVDYVTRACRDRHVSERLCFPRRACVGGGEGHDSEVRRTYVCLT